VAVKPTLLIYGDSLTVLSEGAVNLLYGAKYRLVFRAQGGTSICDWTAHAAQDRAEYRPDRVVIAFTGNAASCSIADLRRGVPAWIANYRRSLLTMRSVFAGLPISVVASPAVLRPQPAGSWYPANGNPLLNQMYAQTCAEYAMHYNTAADDLLTPGHVFHWTRPAFPGNGPAVTVRAPDGVHVTPAGALYYAAALGA
jgi:lysophospholipase L1-like esterase